ncbi:mannose-1-phosphate guanylyltransferase/mannose-6-phosphate isomerase [Solimicrobium silvestre]|uniref:mannose-1-phosphate guanylyltransferase n=1 Tax=Solimicrobium silvestre TaxID=2099400 RepID=A0A2S9H0L3_9BURK|nr:mannose-1-phosphate guanylyltransferase/mannose-6-phosphate isomerase [Solimicrobium silvestre]PRC93519.1 Mannose-1-phosphate guanylyltransferase/mannose-6-phosphate isomerase [Solimicrobium silvestre]
MNTVTPVILCGGSGTRLWPLSRAGFPKQFLVLSGTNSLFQQAISRINSIACTDILLADTLVVTNEEHRFLALEQLREMKSIKATLLLEPVGRNTAPALTFAALHAMANGSDPILAVIPADQTITDDGAYIKALQQCVRIAAEGAIAILGITPDRPETGFGYINFEGELGRNGEYTVTQFTEKPDLKTAQQFLESGDYTWNSGIFVLKASTWLAAIKHFRPDIETATQQAWLGKSEDFAFIRPGKAAFEQIPSASIDYAVMEKCPGSEVAIHMVPLSAGWNDLGAWSAVWMVGEQDANGNVVHGDVLHSDTSNSLIYSSKRLVSAVGVNNLVIVETADAVLVADRAQSQQVKKIVDALEKQNRLEHNTHRKVNRPWGWYDSIVEGERFKVKQIQVKPGAKISLQKHHHRAEHWVVVRGTAEITCGDKVTLLTENQSTYIPLGEVHRLSNPGSIPLEIIEVQSGSYLGEDDIVRYEDNYGRVG